MAFTLPKHVPLARLPTPVHRLDRLSKELGADIWIKRDDQTGAELSGNKIRKLEFVLADAIEKGAKHVITCGGVQSNHARATALAARRLGLVPHLVLRTDDGKAPPESDGNLLLDRIAGAEVTWVTRPQYRDSRAEIMRGIAGKLGSAYVIPEGASDARGALGYVRAVDEIRAQVAAKECPMPGYLVHACGSGGTTAGLSLGVKIFDFDAHPVAFAVCDDVPYFEAILEDIGSDFAKSFGGPSKGPVTIVDRYKGVGYALNTPEEMAFLKKIAEQEGIVLDPVYSLKAFRGMVEEIKAGRTFRKGSTILFVHTGGIFGLFPKKAELTAAAGAPA